MDSEITGLLAEMLNIAPSSITIHDYKGAPLYANQKSFEIHGYTSDEFMALNLFKLDVPRSADLIEERIRIINENGSATFEVEHFKKDGSVIPLEVYVKLVDWKGKTAMLSIATDISERKKSDQLIHESEEKFRTFVESANDIIYQINPQGIFTYVSPNWTEILGYQLNEVIGSNIDEFIHLDDLSSCIDFLNKVLNSGKKQSGVEYRVKHKNGKWRWHSSNATPLKDKEGKFVSLIGVARDITDKMIAQQRLLYSETKYKAAFYTSPDSVNIIKFSGEIIEINEGFTRLTGYTEDEVLGKLSSEINIWAIPEDRLRLNESLSKYGIVENLETIFRTKNGALIPSIMSAKIIEIDNIPHILSVTRDISERKKFEDQIIQKNDEYEALTEELRQTNDELLTAKVRAEENEKRIIFQNHEIELNNNRLESLLKISQYQTNSVQELLDFALHEAIKLTNSKIGYIYFYNEENKQFSLNTWSKDVMKECAVMHPQTIYDLDNTGCWGEAVRQRKPFIINDYQKENTHKKGTPQGHVKLEKFLTIPVFIDSKIVAVAGVANKSQDYDNADIRQLSLLMDSVWKISERIILIKDLTIAKEKAEESDRLKSAFLHNMSHEIRTPMNSIMGFAEILPKYINDKEKTEKFISIINQSCTDLLVIIDDILDVAKIEAGLLKINNERVNILEVLNELELIYNQQKKKLGKQNILLSLSIPDWIAELNITSDKSRLAQIFNNLLNNALKFTMQGKVEFGISRVTENQVEFFVSDTGIGIPESKYEKIFDRFMQVQNDVKLVSAGNGLGLTISKALVNLLGGNIWLQSEVGIGSIFYFTIHTATELEGKKTVIPSLNIPMEASFQNKTILVVEDDEFNRVLLNEILDNIGFNLLFAIKGSEAIRLYLSEKPDLILMDIGLPDMSGYDAIEKILSNNSNAKIIAQTAYASQSDKNKALQSGCIDYISKPLKSDALIDIIKRHI